MSKFKDNRLKIPASRHAFDLWRLGESGGYLVEVDGVTYFGFSSPEQYETYLLLGWNK